MHKYIAAVYFPQTYFAFKINEKLLFKTYYVLCLLFIATTIISEVYI